MPTPGEITLEIKDWLVQHPSLLAKQPCPFSPHYPDVKRPTILGISEPFQRPELSQHMISGCRSESREVFGQRGRGGRLVEGFLWSKWSSVKIKK